MGQSHTTSPEAVHALAKCASGRNLQSPTPFVLSDVQADQAAIWNKTAVALTSHGHAPKPTVKQILGLASKHRSMLLGGLPQV